MDLFKCFLTFQALTVNVIISPIVAHTSKYASLIKIRRIINDVWRRLTLHLGVNPATESANKTLWSPAVIHYDDEDLTAASSNQMIYPPLMASN